MKNQWKQFLSILVIGLSQSFSWAQPSVVPTQRFWRTDGPVHSMVLQSNTLYLGGDFSYVGPATGGLGLLSLDTGAADRSFPAIQGTVSALIPDGQGGWYVGGNFSVQQAGVARTNLAHVFSDHTIDSAWNPRPNGTVASIIVFGNTVYVGGNFTQMVGQNRGRIAAVDRLSGTLLPFNPNANSAVLTMELVDGLLYVGGTLSAVGGQGRARIAAIELATGRPTAWNPNANNVVNTILVDGETIYVGGAFSSIGTKPRNRIAALEAATGVALNWNPNANNAVTVLKQDGETIYAGGNFTSIGGQVRNRIAALDAATGTALGWDPNANDEVKAILPAGDKVYLGGDFTTIGGASRRGIVSINTASGQAEPWNPLLSTFSSSSSPGVQALSRVGNKLSVGGSFLSLGGGRRENAAGLDFRSGELTVWTPDSSAPVTALAAGPDGIFAGGTFTNIGGTTRLRLALLDSVSGEAVADWNAGVANRANLVASVSALAVSDDRLYVGGSFTNIAGAPRTNLAALNLSTAAPLNWNPRTLGAQNGQQGVFTILPAEDLVYVGGEFATIGGQTRSRLAALEAGNGNATAWNPNANGLVSELVLDGDTLYAGGTFTSIGGQVRNRIAALNTTSGLATGWNPDGGGSSPRVYAMDKLGSRLYVGGQFTSIGGEFRNRLASLELATGVTGIWNPNLNNIVRDIVAIPQGFFIGGDFTTINGLGHSYFAFLSNEPEILLSVTDVVSGQFRSRLRPGEGQKITVQHSSDLLNWQNVTPGSVPDGPQEFTEPVTAPVRFYRAVLEVEAD